MCVHLVQGRVDNFYIILDGPHHDDLVQDRLQDAYHVLCTSAGYPAPSQEQIGVLPILVLNGWSESSIKDAVKAFRNTSDDAVASKVYLLSGGRIRLACPWTRNQSRSGSKTVIHACGKENIKLAVTSRSKAGVATTSDRLRTRF